MITRISSLLFLLPTLALADLKVHEWGTFTTLSDSQGTVLRWYSPQSEHSALPKFVKMDGMFMKGAMMTTVRMETPVIYFYPDKPMVVEVEAQLKDGGITEIYPNKLPLQPDQQIGMSPGGMLSVATRWKGQLLPPDDKNALGMIPAVSSDERGAHYAAAREVPDAWIFHYQDNVMDPETRKMKTEEQADKFIFYRGAGNFAQGLHISNPAQNEIHIQNFGKHAYRHGVMLEVRDGKARWSQLPEIEAMGEEVKLVPTHITGEWGSVDDVEAELTGWFQTTLTTQGLTKDEASAMIATWHGTWFRESGLRVFTLMPRAEVDEILPLKIKPAPSKLERVFVNRHELITKSQEEELATLIHDANIESKEAKQRLEALGLGRFEHAAVHERALDIARFRMQMRYQQLVSEEPTAAKP